MRFREIGTGGCELVGTLVAGWDLARAIAMGVVGGIGEGDREGVGDGERTTFDRARCTRRRKRGVVRVTSSMDVSGLSSSSLRAKSLSESSSESEMTMGSAFV